MADAPQNYVLYRTATRGWQEAGYVVLSVMLPAGNTEQAPAGFAYGLDAEKAYEAGDIYKPTQPST